MAGNQRQDEFRKLPSVDALLREPGVSLLIAQFGAEQVTGLARRLLDGARAAIAAGALAPEGASWPGR